MESEKTYNTIYVILSVFICSFVFFSCVNTLLFSRTYFTLEAVNINQNTFFHVNSYCSYVKNTFYLQSVVILNHFEDELWPYANKVYFRYESNTATHISEGFDAKIILALNWSKSYRNSIPKIMSVSTPTVFRLNLFKINNSCFQITTFSFRQFLLNGF